MKITFVIPTLNLTGGIRVVSIYARCLSAFGHEVTVVSPGKKSLTLKQRVKAMIGWKGFSLNNYEQNTFFQNINFELITLDKHRAVEDKDLPDADVVIATFWNTAEWVSKLGESKGKKIYFLQHYEIHPWFPVERVKATLALPFNKITVADWITQVMSETYNDKAAITVPNAVDHSQFDADEREKNKIFRFGMMYSKKAFKGSDMAISAFEKFRHEYPDTQLVAFGTEPESEVKELYPFMEYHFAPPQDAIANIYASCDSWLFTSTNEGFGLPLLEAMACRTPVIGTNTGAAPELLQEGAGILIDVMDAAALQKAMKVMYEMSSEEWTDMSQRAYACAKRYNWTNSAKQFEAALHTFLA